MPRCTTATVWGDQRSTRTGAAVKAGGRPFRPRQLPKTNRGCKTRPPFAIAAVITATEVMIAK